MNNPLRGFVQKYIELKPFIPYFSSLQKGQILEIGCGNGYGASLVHQHSPFLKIFGIDLDPKMISLAKSRKIPNSLFKVASATSLPFSDNYFEAVFDFGVIHHIPNWQDCLNEIRRVVKPGGLFLLEDFSKETFNFGLGRVLKKLFTHPYSSMYLAPQFFSYLEKIGFKIIKKQHHYPLNLLNYFTVVVSK